MTNIFSPENKDLHDIVIHRQKDKISTVLDEETIILDIDAGVYSGLNLVGTTIWRMLETPVSFVEIVKTITKKYNVSEANCTADLIDFLNNLDENQLIIVNDANTT